MFGTSEFRIIPPFYLAGQPDIARLAQEPSFFVWAPSRWSASGFLRLGLRQEQVAMIPLGKHRQGADYQDSGRAQLYLLRPRSGAPTATRFRKSKGFPTEHG